MSPHILSPEEKEARRARIAQLRQEGYAFADIAAMLNLSISTVKAYAEPQRRVDKSYEQRRKRIWELRDQGKSYAQIGAVVGLSKQRVQHILATRPEKAYDTSDAPKRSIALHADGLDWLRKTAAEFGFRRRSGRRTTSDGDVNQLILALQRGDLEIVPAKERTRP